MTPTRIRWTIAAVAALALALLTLAEPVPLTWSELAQTAGAGEACPADAKPANLNFAMKDMNNRTVRLSDYKGKVILLDFWATWCGPFKVEMPWFNEFQQKYGARGLQVIGVSVDDTLDKLKPYVAQMKIAYPVLQGLDHDDVQDAYGPMFGIPVTAVISRGGKVCAKHMGLNAKDAFENEIKALLDPHTTI